MKKEEKYRKVIIYLKTGRKYVHFSDSIDEREIVEAMKSDVFGLEVDKIGFASYKTSDIERIEIR